MTIAAELARLTAIECLAPTAQLQAGEAGVFPTVAGARVYDSRAVAVDELDRAAKYTPVLALYTRKSESARRGPAQGSVDRNGRTTLAIVAELAVAARDEAGGEFADALADDDPEARILLAGLCAQVRWLLTRADGGWLFRRAVMAVDGIEFEPFAVPNLGLRWQRTTMLFDCQIPDDHFLEAGGFPLPASQIISLLPEDGYARRALDRLSAYMPADPPRPPLEASAFEHKPFGTHGAIGKNDAVEPPYITGD